MVRLFKWYRSLGITTKQFIALFGLLFIIFIFLEYDSIKSMEEEFEDQIITESEAAITRTNQFMSTYLDNISNILFIISARNDLLEEGKEEELNKFLSDYEEFNAIIAKTLYIIRNDGKIYCSRKTMLDIFGNPQLDKVYKQAQNVPYGISWSEPYKNLISNRTIAFAMPVQGKSKDNENKILGYAIVEINMEYLEQKFYNLLGDKEFIVTGMDNNLILFDTDDKLLSIDSNDMRVLNQNLMDQLRDLSLGINTIKNSDKTIYAIKADSNVLGWNTHIIIYKQSVDNRMAKIRQNFYLNMLLWLIVLIGITIFITYYFTKPIKKLAITMDKVKDFENVTAIRIKSEDEIGRLTNSYNAMMVRIHNLIIEVRQVEAKKKEYELKMLQSQIGPHFLYNTLACIGSLAKQHKIDEVRETIRSLVNLLSYSFDKRGEFVSLEEELECLNAYINIQKVRYGDIFEFDVKVDTEALQCRVLKLTLQPLVENAIFHGLAPSGSRGFVNVHGHIIEGKLILRVRDNGVGMEREQCKSLLLNKIHNKINDRFSSIGLSNVHDRIRLQFGNGYGLHIYSKKNIGTVIKVCIPCVKEEQTIQGFEDTI